MASKLDTPIRFVPGIGAIRAKSFEKLGIITVRDLLYHFPRGYQNRGDILQVLDCPDKMLGAFNLTVATAPRTAKIKGNRYITKFSAFDESGTCTIVFFNQLYVKDIFKVGATFRFWGRLTRTTGRSELNAPIFEPHTPGTALPDLVPVYPLTAGISQKLISSLICSALKGNYLHDADDTIPIYIRAEYHLPNLTDAMHKVHCPEKLEDTTVALRRFSFERIFVFLLGIGLSKKSIDNRLSYQMCRIDSNPFFSCLDFSLTGAQKLAISEINSDMCNKNAPPMSRILTGDVGSGKTVCAAAAIYTAVKNGTQAALMAPTEILAIQHYNDLRSIFEKLGIKTILLTGAGKKTARRQVLEELESGQVDLIIGTHALLSQDVKFNKLGLVITDEQHRFGVMQRAALIEKSENSASEQETCTRHNNVSAHILVMSATPIPRTLAFILYGDLAISTLDELPPGRQRVDTFAVGRDYLPRIYAFIRRQINAGHQVYVVCPSIEPGENDKNDSFDELTDFRVANLLDDAEETNEKPDDLSSVIKTFERLSKEIFPDIDVGMLHGGMKSHEKDQIMKDFTIGKTKILVSTTVIEVGVNVPNATLMIIENAERFGLAQLHQLRGRVGRGKSKSYCILISNSKSENAHKRLNIMKKSNNGYEIAQKDLEIRGPGDFFPHSSGIARQHGAFDTDLLTGSSDTALLSAAADAAKKILATDPTLALPENAAARAKVENLFEIEINTIH